MKRYDFKYIDEYTSIKAIEMHDGKFVKWEDHKKNDIEFAEKLSNIEYDLHNLIANKIYGGRN